MAQQYISNILIGDLTLDLNPAQYDHKWKKYGSYKRTIGGGIVDVIVNGNKLLVDIKGIAQTQIEEIKKRVALNKFIAFRDYVPIAEKNTKSRTVFEDLGSETIDSELIHLYIPTYSILIMNFSQTYANNMVTYNLTGEET